MSEAMTVERIIEADWLLQEGYWVKPRFAWQTEKGGWSDIDVLAYNPETKHLVVAESKVYGTKRTVYAYTAQTHKRYGDILDFDKGAYFGFLDHLKKICTDGVIFPNFVAMVKRLTVQHVSNYVVMDGLLVQARQSVHDCILPSIPPSVEFDVLLETTLDVFCRIIENERRSTQGKRYGHPVVDIAREMNRYMDPAVEYGGRGAGAQVKQYFHDRLCAALGFAISPASAAK